MAEKLVRPHDIEEYWAEPDIMTVFCYWADNYGKCRNWQGSQHCPFCGTVVEKPEKVANR